MSDTDKCPKCGSDITYHGTARPVGGGQVARCYNCGFAAEKTLIEEQIVVAAKHRIRELEARCEESERNRVIVHTPPLPESVVFDALRSQTQQWQEEVMRMRVRMADMHKRIRELEDDNAILSGGVDALEGLKDAYMDELTEAKSTVKELVVALADVLLQAASGDKAGEIDDMGITAYEEASELLIRAGVAEPLPRGCVIDGKRLAGFEPIFGQAREALKK